MLTISRDRHQQFLDLDCHPTTNFNRCESYSFFSLSPPRPQSPRYNVTIASKGKRALPPIESSAEFGSSIQVENASLFQVRNYCHQLYLSANNRAASVVACLTRYKLRKGEKRDSRN